MKNNLPILIDFDGIINLGGTVAKDAKDFLEFLTQNKIPSHIISNSTLKTSKDVRAFLTEYSIQSSIPIMTTVDASYNYIKKNYKKISVYCEEKIRQVFQEFIDEENPEAVLIGDLGAGWTYETMNNIFRKVIAGAEIIAMQMNKYWKPDGKTLSLDAGPFINAIEYATGKQAILIGKPSGLYFESALQQLEFSINENFIMIGDDYDNDILAAQNIGGKGILVYTGKTKYPLPKENKIKPSHEAQNLTEVISILKETL
jgi:HAD superfamily hydrolase (TIGR01458 family)